MAYRLIYSQAAGPPAKDVGENIFFADLPFDYPVYLFYYSGAMPDEDLENRLRKFGQKTGRNLLVNIGSLVDPHYKKVSKLFGIKSFPVIVMTAADRLAASSGQPFTAFVKMDSKALLGRPDLTLACVEKLFNLFLQGEMAEAMKEFRRDNLGAVFSRFQALLEGALKGLADFLKGWNVSYSVFEGKLEVKYEGR